MIEHLKEYVSLLLGTLVRPSLTLNKVINKESKFHVIYYMTFSFLLASIMSFTYALNPEGAIFHNQNSNIGINESILITLAVTPFFLFIFSLYFDFAQYAIFKIKSLALDYFKTVLWSFHFMVILLCIMAPLSVIAFNITESLLIASEFLLLFPFIHMIFLIFWGMKIASTKTFIKTLFTFIIGVIVFAAPAYLIL